MDSPIIFKQAVCLRYGITPEKYTSFVLNRCLFRRMRWIAPIIGVFNADFLFHERRLIRSVAKAGNMREVQEEIDFYHHKYIVNHLLRDAFCFRLSGMRLMSLANAVFKEYNRQEGTRDKPQKPDRP